jgi:RHS repeat-associated protein
VQPPQPPVTVFGDVEYGPGGEMTRFGTETRAYNVLGQLTRITKPGAMDLEYRYSATANDGRISSQNDWVSGEEVVYQYDLLKRLIRAESVGPEWGQSFTYDGWGNMRAMNVVKGSAPVMATTADPVTNRFGAWGYDANGNATSLPGATTMNLIYDAANRLLHAADGSSVDEWYAYAADNKRVWKRIGTTGVPVVAFWGIDGTRMGEFTVEQRTPEGGSLTLALVRASTPPLTFAGKRIMTEDRLGSVNGSYYPYGQPKSGQTGAGERFATYYKDATGLEYAQNRYYSSTWGRFVTADPSEPGGPEEPQSHNLFAYVLNDSVNFSDPEGLDVNVPISDSQTPTCLTRVFPEVITPSGFGTMNDDDAATRFFSSLEGTFGLSIFFEVRPSAYTTDKNSPVYQAALGVGYVYINRYVAQWGAESGFHSLKKVVMDASTPIWNRGPGDSRMMRDEYRDKLYRILNGPPNSGDCDGLIWALHLAQSMVAHSVGISHALPRQLPVYNPVGDALAFHSLSKPTVPKGWNKRLRLSRTIWIPLFGGGAAPFHFFVLPGVTLPTH